MGFFQKIKELREEKIKHFNEKLSPWVDEQKESTECEIKQDMESFPEEVEKEIADTEKDIRSEVESSHPTNVKSVSSPSFTPMYDEQLEKLIGIALADGELSEKERTILFKRAESLGIDLDEFEMVLDSRLGEIQAQKAQKKDVSLGDKDPVVQDLLKKLSELEGNQGVGFFSDLKLKSLYTKKARVIKNHPIPDTKAGILEMLALAAPQGKKLSKIQLITRDDTEVYEAWREKCGQIITKARFFMKDDPMALRQIEQYAEELEL